MVPLRQRRSERPREREREGERGEGGGGGERYSSVVGLLLRLFQAEQEAQ